MDVDGAMPVKRGRPPCARPPCTGALPMGSCGCAMSGCESRLQLLLRAKVAWVVASSLTTRLVASGRARRRPAGHVQRGGDDIMELLGGCAVTQWRQGYVTDRQTDRQNFGHTNCGCTDAATVYGWGSCHFESLSVCVCGLSECSHRFSRLIYRPFLPSIYGSRGPALSPRPPNPTHTRTPRRAGP